MLRLAFIYPLFLVLGTTGCAGVPPYNEYNISREALRAAKNSGASQHAPGYWSQAEELYRKAEDLYQNREYDKSREAFLEAQKSAERAENITRLKKSKSGEMF